LVAYCSLPVCISLPVSHCWFELEFIGAGVVMSPTILH
jgi:hypothetical protein